MWTLPEPTTSENELKTHLSVAMTYTDGTPIYPISEDEKREILKAYKAYLKRKGLPSKDLVYESLGTPLLEAVKTAYGEVRKRGRLKSLREKLMIAAPGCPYCGFGEVTDLDHHLPKTTYKAFSIYPHNLVPSCGTCNGKKLTAAHEEADKQFHHVYLGDIPEGVFFKAQVALAPNSLTATYRVEQIAGMPLETFQRLAFQITRLNLNERYRREVSTFLNDQINSFELAFGADGSLGLKQFLEKSIVTAEGNHGKNHWKTVLLRALLECEDFCNGRFKEVLGQKNNAGSAGS